MDTEQRKIPDYGDTAVWAVTPGGEELGARLCAKLPNALLYLPSKHTASTAKDVQLYDSLPDRIQKEFHHHRTHIFIFATGIAVRLIAPFLQCKTKDPAVIVLDEKAQFAISLVSGHLGGANEMTRKIAAAIGAVPVITTATDLNDLPAIDLMALNRGLTIETPENIKHVNMAFIKGRKISAFDPMGLIAPDLPENLIKKVGADHSPWDLICTMETKKVSRETLILRPRVLSVGIGCNRNTSAEEILGLLAAVFKQNHLSPFSIKSIASAEVKKDEAGLIEAANRQTLPIVFYSKDELNRVNTVENPSKMAEKHIGVKSVCEAAAILGARKGKLLVPKQKTKNVTLAVAVIQ
jgi:cobalt-precorrin 5A hydrolase